METLPSKELLSEVLNREILHIYKDNEEVDWKYYPTNNDICYEGKSDIVFMLNKYELMHMMKKYALDNGYDILSSSRGQADIYFDDPEYWQHQIFDTELTEFEAVTKACEYILKQKEENEQ